MKNRLIYENLDTSFVNLAALVRFLRARNFAGSIQIELGEYEGEIFFTTNNEMSAREHDRASGRVAEGEDALQRLLIRAREPGGIVHVYQTAMEIVADDAKNSVAEPRINEYAETISSDAPVPHSSPVRIFQQPLSLSKPLRSAENQISDEKNKITAEVRPNLKTPDFPFEFSNNVETKARRIQLSETDWQTLLRLTAELLGALDDTLARNNLNFGAAFEKARAETARDYPFLAPNADVFVYRNGNVEMAEQINVKLFAAGINETLRRILEKLAANPKFSEIYRETTQKILSVIRENKMLYDRFFFTPQLEKILGV